MKSRDILDFFIEHFIKMTEVGTRITSKDQILFYLKQALYLTKILEKLSPSFEPDVEDYRERLQTLENMVKRQVAVKRESLETSSLAPPETPVRNSAAFDFTNGNSKKITLQRQKSINNNLVNPITTVKKATSIKQTSGPTYRKRIAFVEPDK